jgi:HD-like signal output (HDOD) protein
MDRLRRHSVAVAHLSRALGREAGVVDEGAFMCGLLHDVGIATCLIAIVESTPPDHDPPAFEEVWPAVRQAHSYAGGLVASLWKFPSDVTFVIERHHDFLIDAHPHPLASLVFLADWAAHELGYGIEDEQGDEGGPMVLDALGLGAPAAQALLSKASKTLERIG